MSFFSILLYWFYEFCTIYDAMPQSLIQAQKNIAVKGFLDLPVPKKEELVEEIKLLKLARNAVILAHYYQTPEIQDIADFSVPRQKCVGQGFCERWRLGNSWDCCLSGRGICSCAFVC